MNLVKNVLRTRLTQENLQHQMRIVIDGEPFELYGPLPAVEHWLKSGNRHITHKKPTASSSVPCAIASTSKELVISDSD